MTRAGIDVTTNSGDLANESAALLHELATGVPADAAVPESLWRRLRAAWPEPTALAEILRDADVDPLRWPEPLTTSATRVVHRDPAPAVVLAIASLGVFMAFLDDTVVGIAFPDMVSSFGGTDLTELSWVLNAYNIAFASLMVPAGRIADRFGRRRTYAAGIVLFTAGSILAAAAPSLGGLVAARALQGVGAAVIVPASLAIVLESTRPELRAQAVAIWSATAALAAGLGPSIGGVLVDAAGWRLVFLVNVPFGVAAWWLVRRYVTESRAPGRRDRLDLQGALLLALAIGLLVLAIVQGPAWGWSSVGVLLAASGAVVAGLQVARRCRWHPSPVVDLELLRTRGCAVTSALTLVGSAGFFALGLANVLFLMTAWGYTPLQAGLATTPAPILATLAAGAAGWLASRVDPRRLVVVGACVWTMGALMLVRLMTSQPDFLGAYLPSAAVLGLGIGFTFPLVSDAAVAVAPQGRYAGATAFNSAIRQIGAALGVAVLAVVLGPDASTGSIDGFRVAWWGAAVCFAAVAVGALLLPPLPKPGLAEAGALEARRAALARRSPPAGLPRSARVDSNRTEERGPRAEAPSAGLRADESDAALLADVSLFAPLPEPARVWLADRCTTVRLAGGDWLFQEGDEADALYIVRSGRLEVVQADGDGTLTAFHELGRGSVVGELALLSDAPRSASVRGRRGAVLLRLDREDFDALLAQRAEYALTVARVLAEQLQRSRVIDTQPEARAVTVAVVNAVRGGRGATFEAQLVSALRPLRRVCRLGADDVGSPGEQAGISLARTLDRVERDHDLVVLSAQGVGEPWLDSCLRQADLTLLVLDDDVRPWRAPGAVELLHGCDVVLLAAPTRSDVQEVLDALEPRTTHRIRSAGDVRRLARRLAGRSTGLVLSGGGARAFAHIGVLDELTAAGVTVDRIGGASMGAFIGALVAQGMDTDEIYARCHLEFVRRNPIGDYRVPGAALTAGERARTMLERNLEGLIEDLSLPFSCVTTDLISAELIVHRRGRLAPAVGASMCLPGISPPVALGRRLLVDGAVLDSLPIAAMAAENAGPIIASDVTRAEQRSLAPDEPVPETGLFDTLARVLMLSTADTEELGRRHAEVYIAPDHEFVGQLEFHMIDRMRAAGRRAALDALEKAPPGIFQ